MKLNSSKIYLLLFLFFLINCSSASSYWKDRGNDFTDIAGIKFGWGLVAPDVGVGPVSFGSGGIVYGRCKSSEKISSKNMVFSDVYETYTGNPGKASQKVSLFAYYEEIICEDSRGKGFEHSGYINTEKKYILTRLQVSVALILGICFEFNPGELLDFFTGFFGYDLYEDDTHTKTDFGNKIPKDDLKNILKYGE